MTQAASVHKQIHRLGDASQAVGQRIGDGLPGVVTDRHPEVEIAQLVTGAACDRALKLEHPDPFVGAADGEHLIEQRRVPG